MRWALIIVIIFSILTIFELHKEYGRNNVSKKCFTIITAMEGIAAVIAMVLLFLVQ